MHIRLHTCLQLYLALQWLHAPLREHETLAPHLRSSPDTATDGVVPWQRPTVHIPTRPHLRSSPDTRMPSAGRMSPVSTTRMSPTNRSCVLMTRSTPPRMTRTCMTHVYTHTYTHAHACMGRSVRTIGEHMHASSGTRAYRVTCDACAHFWLSGSLCVGAIWPDAAWLVQQCLLHLTELHALRLDQRGCSYGNQAHLYVVFDSVQNTELGLFLIVGRSADTDLWTCTHTHTHTHTYTHTRTHNTHNNKCWHDRMRSSNQCTSCISPSYSVRVCVCACVRVYCVTHHNEYRS